MFNEKSCPNGRFKICRPILLFYQVENVSWTQWKHPCGLRTRSIVLTLGWGGKTTQHKAVTSPDSFSNISYIPGFSGPWTSNPVFILTSKYNRFISKKGSTSRTKDPPRRSDLQPPDPSTSMVQNLYSNLTSYRSYQSRLAPPSSLQDSARLL